MSLTFVSLASGSKGNATLIISNNTAILVDAGLSYTAIASALREFGLTPSRLDGVVITHEHGDHIRALNRLCEDTKLYIHPLTARAIDEKYGRIKNIAHVDDFENGFTIGDINVEPFRIPHDAAYPLAYSFECGGARCSVATDIGVPTVGVLKNIKDSSLVLLESNHDIDMLKNGKYPYPLKQRILSNNGHLSNDAAARIVQLLNDDRTSRVNKIVLGHISEN
ncbi:MAG: MBL fold metallo-hydrolase, partial [Clostridia bacterium]|nr:MBL fold metallo-hydrolase [Clostridia bacterium]